MGRTGCGTDGVFHRSVSATPSGLSVLCMTEFVTVSKRMERWSRLGRRDASWPLLARPSAPRFVALLYLDCGSDPHGGVAPQNGQTWPGSTEVGAIWDRTWPGRKLARCGPDLPTPGQLLQNDFGRNPDNSDIEPTSVASALSFVTSGQLSPKLGQILPNSRQICPTSGQILVNIASQLWSFPSNATWQHSIELQRNLAKSGKTCPSLSQALANSSQIPTRPVSGQIYLVHIASEFSPFHGRLA